MGLGPRLGLTSAGLLFQKGPWRVEQMDGLIYRVACCIAIRMLEVLLLMLLTLLDVAYIKEQLPNKEGRCPVCSNKAMDDLSSQPIYVL